MFIELNKKGWALHYTYREFGWFPVIGKTVKIKGWNEYDYFVYSAVQLDYCKEEILGCKYGGGINHFNADMIIIEKSTGLQVGVGDTIKEAIENTKFKLDTKGKDFINSRMSIVKAGQDDHYDNWKPLEESGVL